MNCNKIRSPVQWVQWKDAIDRNGVCFSPILTEINGCQYVHYTYKDAIDEPRQLEEGNQCNNGDN